MTNMGTRVLWRGSPRRLKNCGNRDFIGPRREERE